MNAEGSSNLSTIGIAFLCNWQRVLVGWLVDAMIRPASSRSCFGVVIHRCNHNRINDSAAVAHHASILCSLLRYQCTYTRIHVHRHIVSKSFQLPSKLDLVHANIDDTSRSMPLQAKAML